MNILYYTWNENSESDLLEALLQLGHSVVRCHIPFHDYEEDTHFSSTLEHLFLEKQCDCFFSFDFFPLIAKSAQHLKKIYISWIYDCPHYTCFSPSALSDWVKLFIFDRNFFELMCQRKTSGIFHMPLAANTERLTKQLNLLEEENISYTNQISFVGSLYENNSYRQVHYLPEYVKGLLDGVLHAQHHVYGYSFIEEILHSSLDKELEKYIQMSLPPSYQVNPAFLYSNMLYTELTARERVDYLMDASQETSVALYTASELPSSLQTSPTILAMGNVTYKEQMPQIFKTSKINLNITLRSITSGIPLRAIDIMACGGFLLSNYQPELAEYFTDGEDLVLFDSSNDLRQKLHYYLTHEEERKKIAKNGFKKVCQNHSYDTILPKIFQLAFS